MPRFEDLQALWQRQPAPLMTAELTRLHRSLREYGIRQNRIYAVKAALVGAVLVWASVHARGSAVVLGAVAAALVIAALLMFVDWRQSRAIARLDFTGASVAFVRRAIEQLSSQREPFRKYYWQFVGSLAAIDNTVMLLKHPPTLRARIGWHLFATALPFAVYEFGRRVRILRFESECRPIIDRLSAIRRELEEASE